MLSAMCLKCIFIFKHLNEIQLIKTSQGLIMAIPTLKNEKILKQGSSRKAIENHKLLNTMSSIDESNSKIFCFKQIENEEINTLMLCIDVGLVAFITKHLQLFHLGRQHQSLHPPLIFALPFF